MPSFALPWALATLCACGAKTTDAGDAVAAPSATVDAREPSVGDAAPRDPSVGDASDTTPERDATPETDMAGHGDAAMERDTNGAGAAAIDGDTNGEGGAAMERDAARAEPARMSSTIAVDGAGALELRGFPAASSDGMHVGLVVGDAARGPLALRVVRIDGSTLLEHAIVERARSDESAAAPPSRRLAHRAAAAQRVLERADMRALAPLPTSAYATSSDTLTVTLPGYVAGVYPSAVLARGCMTHRVLGVFADGEHGLVVVHLAHTPSEACPAAPDDEPYLDNDWRVFALTALP